MHIVAIARRPTLSQSDAMRGVDQARTSRSQCDITHTRAVA